MVEVALIAGAPGRGPCATAPARAGVDIPCFVYVLRCGEMTVLADSGPDPAQARVGGFEVIGAPHTTLERALASVGRRCADVSLIIHSHLHYDHIQNDGLFPNARVAVQAREVAWAQTERADRFCVGISAFLAHLGHRLTLLDGDVELAPGLCAIVTGGHTPGHQAVLVEHETGTVCLCGDVMPLAEGRSAVPVDAADPTAVPAFFRRAHEAAWQLVPSHDPGLRDHPWFWGSGSE